MAKYAWCSDIHLDCLGGSDEKIIDFTKELVKTDPTGIFVTGDISVAPSLIYHLSVMERVAQRPTYFILGNHDYYRGDITTVRKQMRELTNASQFLRYLPLSSYVPLSPATALVGHDGWYDAGYGDALNSKFLMNDWILISDFIQHSGGGSFVNMMHDVKDKASIIGVARRLAHEGVTHVMNGIKSAVRYHKNVIVLTHFPPFQESHIYRGTVGDAHAQPWFTSKMMGDMLLDAAKAYPAVSFTVLAGHTHGKYDGRIAKNMEIHVAAADYGRPDLAGLIEAL